MNVISRLLDILKWIFILALIFLMFLNVMSNPKGPGLFGLKGYSVLSNSMQPVFSAGDYLVAYQTDYEDLETGNIITFQLDNQLIVTHRIADRIYDGYVTKGDANEFVDEFIATPESYVAKYVFHIPYLGQILIWLSHPLVFVAFCFIIAIRLLYSHFKERRQNSEKLI